MFNAVYDSECVPSLWWQGAIIHAYKRRDASDVGNYRPLTIMTCVDKLFSSLLVRRLRRTMRLHDQQYAFHPGRGTLNALHSIVDKLQSQTEQRLLTYAYIFL